MRLGNRWSILGLGLLCLLAFWGLGSMNDSGVLAEGTPPAVDSNETDVVDAPSAPSSEEFPLLLEDPEQINLTHEGCHAKVFCSDGTTRECQGSAGESCSTGSESCQDAGCISSGTRKFALCGTEKLTCPCDCPSCPDPDCPAGQLCKSHSVCGPCGACLGGRCVCIA